MKRSARIIASAAACLAAATAISACGTQGIALSKSNPYYPGAVVFRDHCSGCHSLAVVGAEGSASNVENRVKTNGPDFNYRKETVQQILYAVRNGGFSGEIMPENIVVGRQAEEVAKFLAKYSGLEKPKEPGESVVVGEPSATEAAKAGEAAASGGAAAAGEEPPVTKSAATSGTKK